MAYEPIQSPKWSDRDALPQGDQRKIIKAADFDTEFSNIKAAFDELAGQNAFLTTCKYNGTAIKYAYNVSSVEALGGGAWRVNFETPINNDDTITLPDGQVVNPGDFAAVVTPYTTNGRMVIATITDQREAYIDIAFRELDGGSWVAPSTQGFALMLIDQVPA